MRNRRFSLQRPWSSRSRIQLGEQRRVDLRWLREASLCVTCRQFRGEVAIATSTGRIEVAIFMVISSRQIRVCVREYELTSGHSCDRRRAALPVEGGAVGGAIGYGRLADRPFKAGDMRKQIASILQTRR